MLDLTWPQIYEWGMSRQGAWDMGWWMGFVSGIFYLWFCKWFAAKWREREGE